MRYIVTFAVLAAVSFGQQGGTLLGIVTDQKNQAIPGAQVVITDEQTGARRTTVTGAHGEYAAPALATGVYGVTFRAPGFLDDVHAHVHVDVGRQVTLNSELALAGADTIVQVDAPLFGNSTETESGIVNEREIRDLPLNGRTFDELLPLNPGVVNFTWEKTGGVGVSNSTVGNDFAVSGNRPQQNLFLLNGVEFTGAAENNMQPGGVSQVLLGVDAVREFNALRDTYGAQYGKHPGAQVLIVTQAGTNAFHGSIYEFLRNNDLDARNFFDGASTPGFQRNQYGVSAGGPIRKDRTFFFANFEGLNQHLHQTGVDLVPDTAARAGYLPCKLVKPAPATCPADGLVFVGVSPLMNAWPTPSSGAPDFGGISEAFNNPLQTIRDDFGTARLDQLVGHRDTVSGVYTIDDSSAFTPTSTNAYSTDVETLREQVASVQETHIFSPTALNSVRIGFSRAGYFFTGEPTPGTPAASLSGFLAGDPIGALVVGGSAASNPTAQLSLAGSNNGSNLRVTRNLFTYADDFSIITGRHRIEGGVWFQRLQSNEMLALSQYGQATFTSLQTLLQGVAGSLLIDPSPTEMNWRSLFSAGYVQDTMRLGPAVTLSLGLRVESTTGWNEAHGHASNYGFTNGVISTTPYTGNSVFTKNNGAFLPEPRIGLAWKAGENTIVRVGAGLYNDLQDALGYRTDQNAPFNATYSIPNVAIAQLPIVPGAALPAGTKLSPGGVQPDLKTPSVIQWSLRIEQNVTQNTGFTIGYVGSHGYHELIGIDANEPFPVICPAAPCPATLPGVLSKELVPAGTYYVPTAVRANPALANTWTYFSEGDSSYNALQTEIEHRWTRGLSFRGSYTWAKTIDDGSSPNATTSGGEPALASNPFDLRADRGLSNFDVRHAASASATYALPFRRNALVRGWTLNTVVTAQSGFPFTPQLSYNPSNNGDTRNPVRPFVNPAFSGPVILGQPNQWFDPSAFIAAPSGSGFYGDLGRDTLIGPGLITADISALKDFSLGERAAVQFRAEAFNALNHPNFNTPNAVVFTPTGVSPTAGVITSTSSSSRQIQFGLKLLW